MWTLIAIPGTCWLCALLAQPRQPLLGNESEDLVYRRLLGRQHRVVLLALLLTLAAFIALIAALPGQVRSDLPSETAPRQICTDAPNVQPICYTEQADGWWSVDVLDGNGGWMRMGTVPHAPIPEKLSSGGRG